MFKVGDKVRVRVGYHYIKFDPATIWTITDIDPYRWAVKLHRDIRPGESKVSDIAASINAIEKLYEHANYCQQGVSGVCDCGMEQEHLSDHAKNADQQ